MGKVDEQTLTEGTDSKADSVVLDFGGANFEEAYRRMEEDVGKEAADATKEVAGKVCAHLDPKKPGSEVTLLFGMIQSGKTGALTQSLALARDNGFRLFVVLSMDNEALYEQTATRLQEAFPLMVFVRKTQVKPNAWKEAKQALIEEADRTGPGVVVFLSKNSTILQHAIELFRRAGVADVPTVIFDDEADQASLNGRQMRDLSGDTDSNKGIQEVTKVHKCVTKLRDFFKHNAYVAVTATPQALFLQQVGALHRPNYHVVIPSGSTYQGGDYFLVERSADVYKQVSDIEVHEYLKPSKIVSRNSLPEGLRKALAMFFVAGSFGIAHDKAQAVPRNRYSMLIHISARQVDHDRIVEGVSKYAKYLKAKLDEKQVPDEVAEAYDDVRTTTEKSGRTVPSLEDVVRTIQSFAVPAQVLAVNAKNTGRMDFTKIQMYKVFNVFVGGNVLGRGITIHGLINTYYGRNSNQPQMDTVMQHARWYGYRRKLEPYIRVFAPKSVWDRFLQLHHHDVELREAALRYLQSEQPIVPLLVPDKLKPTRRNVLDPGCLGTYAGGVTVYQRLPNASKSSQVTDSIEDLLAKKAFRKFDGREVGFVSVDEACDILERLPTSPGQRMSTWNNDAVKASLIALSRVLKHDKVRVVRAGPLERSRSRETVMPYHINSFIASAPKGQKSIDEQIVESPEGFDPPGETCLAPTLYLFRVKKDSRSAGIGWGDPMDPDGSESDMKGTPAPEDFFVPGFHPPSFIQDSDGKKTGYGIVFALP